MDKDVEFKVQDRQLLRMLQRGRDYIALYEYGVEPLECCSVLF
jgi:hypothetical protein